MSESYFHVFKPVYSNEIAKIDEELISLWLERRKQTGEKNYAPPKEVLENWSRKFNIPVPELHWFLHTVNQKKRFSPIPDELGKLTGVLSLMKQTEFKEWQYTLTHAMQHEKGSVIHLKVNSNTHTGIIRTQLLLTIDGPEDYHVSRHNSSSGPGEAHASYQVFPALPMDIENLHFTLVPYAPPIEEPPKTIILNKTIEFLKSGGN